MLPFWWSLGVVAVLKLVTAAMGAFLLGRALGMRFAGSLMAGLVFGFGLFYVVWLPWPLTNVWAWLPWVLLGVHAVVRSGVVAAQVRWVVRLMRCCSAVWCLAE